MLTGIPKEVRLEPWLEEAISQYVAGLCKTHNVNADAVVAVEFGFRQDIAYFGPNPPAGIQPFFANGVDPRVEVEFCITVKHPDGSRSVKGDKTHFFCPTGISGFKAGFLIVSDQRI